jgi:hypothetical protein
MGFLPFRDLHRDWMSFMLIFGWETQFIRNSVYNLDTSSHNVGVYPQNIYFLH